MDNMTCKVLFLDIDGVLNHAAYGEDLYFDKFAAENLAIDTDNLDCLKKLLNNVPDLKIVWSTSWGTVNDERWNKWLNPRLWLEKQDFMKDRILGITPRKMSSEHYHEIKWWLDDHKDIKTYVILEDNYFPMNWFGIDEHLVRIDNEYGLTTADVDKAISILKSV